MRTYKEMDQVVVLGTVNISVCMCVCVFGRGGGGQ